MLKDENREIYDTTYDTTYDTSYDTTYDYFDTVSPIPMTMMSPFTRSGENSMMSPFTTSGKNSIMRTSSRQYTKTMGKPGEFSLEDSIYVNGKPKKQRKEHYLVNENGMLKRVVPKLKDDDGALKRVVPNLTHKKKIIPKNKFLKKLILHFFFKSFFFSMRQKKNVWEKK